MADPNDFATLIRRVRAGDGGAAGELMRRYEPAIRRAVRVRLVDARLRRLLDSTDICQSVFGSFFVRTALGQYDLDTPQQLLQLLVDMSRKKLIDQERHWRAARRDVRRVEPAVCDAPVEDRPSRDLAARDLLDAVRHRLTAEERHLAEQRALGRDWGQIAGDRGESPDALRKRLRRAADRVARELGLDDDADD